MSMDGGRVSNSRWLAANNFPQADMQGKKKWGERRGWRKHDHPPMPPKAQLLGSEFPLARRAEYTVRTSIAYSTVPSERSKTNPPAAWAGGLHSFLLGNHNIKAHTRWVFSLERRNDAVPRGSLFASGIQPLCLGGSSRTHRTSPPKERGLGEAVKIVCGFHWAAASNSGKTQASIRILFCCKSALLLPGPAVGALSTRFSP